MLLYLMSRGIEMSMYRLPWSELVDTVSLSYSLPQSRVCVCVCACTHTHKCVSLCMVLTLNSKGAHQVNMHPASLSCNLDWFSM